MRVLPWSLACYILPKPLQLVSTATRPSRSDALSGLTPSLLPSHLAVIMDGNARWAESRGMPRARGHAAGVESLRLLVSNCLSVNIQTLTGYAFSIENWGRPPQEVDALLGLIESVLEAEAEELISRGVRLRFIGELDMLPARLRALTQRISRTPPKEQRLLLCVALRYGARRELARAMRELAERVVSGELSAGDLDEEMLTRHLHASPNAAPTDPDLLIRTGGRRRLSNFLLYQCAYSEISCVECLWPDFGSAELEAVLREFGGGERTFGLRPSQAHAAQEGQ